MKKEDIIFTIYPKYVDLECSAGYYEEPNDYFEKTSNSLLDIILENHTITDEYEQSLEYDFEQLIKYIPSDDHFIYPFDRKNEYGGVDLFYCNFLNGFYSDETAKIIYENIIKETQK